METEKAITINEYSSTSYYVEMYFNDIKLSNATCFFTKRNKKRFVVSNWHVFSGKDADTLECLDKNAAIPNKLRIYLPFDKEGYADEDEYIDIDLYDSEGNPKWYDIDKNGKKIDIAVIPVEEPIERYILDIEDAEEPFNESTDLKVADEIYILGFPFGKIGGYLPIWKKASVASEPAIDLNDMPYYFADTATKSGMSGSPVILYEKRPAVIINSTEQKLSRYRTKFVGVYSGRIGANTGNKNDAQLGRVWKVESIDEIINTHKL